ncbi:MAG: hypothetical protein IJI45_18985 [Anaerolineaceae bacterium]|nr:hypothetical protein [Anaerolineaceae bacterium]
MKKLLGLLLAVMLCFSFVSAHADSTTYTPELTNALFKDDSCSQILSSSYNRALLSVLLYLDLVTQDVLDMDSFADTISNSYVGKPNQNSIRDLAVVVVMYNDSDIYILTYTPLLETCNFSKIDRGGLSSGLIDYALDQYIDDRKANNLDDILSVVTTISETINK